MSEIDSPDVSRRIIGTTLIGAIGALTLGACAPSSDAASESLDEIGSAVTADVLDYAALREIATKPSGPSQKSVCVRGRTKEGDGAQGVFVWDGTSPPLPDDGGTIIMPNDRVYAEPGRWRRVYGDHVNVRWFGASPDPSIDSTAAVVAAIKAARATATVYFPGGTYAVDADRLTPEALVLHAGARLQGELHSSTPISVIRARSVGGTLVRATVRLVLEHLTLDCAAKVDRGVELLTAHGSALRDVVVKNAKQEGIVSSRYSAATGESAALRFDQVVVEWCGGIGIDLQGPNGSLLTHVVAQYNRGAGIRISGNGSAGAAQVGSFVMVGGVVARNGKQSWPSLSGPCDESQIIVGGVECGHISGTFIEADSVAAVRLADGTRGFTLESLRINGSATSNRALLLQGVAACDVSNCCVVGNSAYCGIRIEDGTSFPCDDNCVRGGFGLTPSGESPLAVDRVASSGSWSAETRSVGLASDAPPSVGSWRHGTVVYNRSPQAGEPVGWACVESATNTWLAIHGHEPPVSTPGTSDVVDVGASSVVKLRGGIRRTLTGGYDGKVVVLVSADPVTALELRHMETGSAGGNIHLTSGSSATIPAGGTITLLRVSVDSGTGENWGDGIAAATRWCEIGRSV